MSRSSGTDKWFTWSVQMTIRAALISIHISHTIKGRIPLYTSPHQNAQPLELEQHNGLSLSMSKTCVCLWIDTVSITCHIQRKYHLSFKKVVAWIETGCLSLI
eukprot:193805_1